jgi:hypothetical protein
VTVDAIQIPIPRDGMVVEVVPADSSDPRDTRETRSMRNWMNQITDRLGKLSSSVSVVTVTTNYTALATDDVILVDCTAGDVTITLPAASTAGSGLTPRLAIRRIDNSANTCTLAAAGTDTVDGAASVTLAATGAATGYLGREFASNSVSLWFTDLSHSVGGGGGGGGTITTQDEGVTLSSTVNTLNFVGAGVTASGAGATTTVTIPGGSSSPLTTKGDIYGHSTVDARVPVGSDGQILYADSAQTLGIKWAAPPAVGVLQSQLFTSSGTFNVPSGVTGVWVSGVGAGGGGSCRNAAATAGGGGGSGEYVISFPVNVTSSGTVTVTIGAGGPGAAGGAAAAGTDGGASSFGASISIAGGKAGTSAGVGGAGGGPKAGTGGAGSGVVGLSGTQESPQHFGGGGGGGGGNTTTTAGGAGASAGSNAGTAGGAVAASNAGGGSGASTPWGAGGAGGTGGGAGTAATSNNYGAGGGGASGTAAAGKGADGMVLVMWVA